jgi:hypothetical protein
MAGVEGRFAGISGAGDLASAAALAVGLAMMAAAPPADAPE